MYFSVTKARIYLNLGMPEEAIKTFDELGIGGYNSVKEGMSDEDCYKLWITMQVMAKAFLMNNEPKSAQVCINECKKVWEKLQGFVERAELAEFESTNASLQKKVEMEIQKKNFVGDLNQYAFIQGSEAAQKQAAAQAQPAKARINPKFDWYQNAQFVFISFKIEGGDKNLAKNSKVKFEKDSVTIESEEQTIDLKLSNQIDTENSVKNAFEKKMELKLKKVQEGVNWISLEPTKAGSAVTQAAAVAVQQPSPADPQKVRPYASNKNWDQIDREIQKDLDSEKPEGDSALNGLFKQIYERADPDTRRAMMKSYQTSGGTVLSTNWNEVAEKDYEGKDRPSAPDGQMWADEAEKIKKQGQSS